VKILLESGIGTHEKSLNGLTALHLATQNGYPEVVKLLLERKAHVNAADDEGKTPLNYAVDARNQEIAQLLSMNGGKASLETHTPVRTSSGRGLEIFGFGGKDFSWSPDTGLEPIKKKTSDQHHATGFDYEPGYIDEVY
jgi:ankyrin repeat protein